MSNETLSQTPATVILFLADGKLTSAVRFVWSGRKSIKSLARPYRMNHAPAIPGWALDAIEDAGW